MKNTLKFIVNVYAGAMSHMLAVNILMMGSDVTQHIAFAVTAPINVYVAWNAYEILFD